MQLHSALPCSLLLLCVAVLPLAAQSLQVNAEGSAADLTARGNTALHNRRYDTALAHYQRALELDQNYFYALYNIGLTYQERARSLRDPEARVPLYQDARRYYARAQRQRPDNAEALNNLGIIAFELGEHQLAAQLFQSAHEKADNRHHSAEYAYNRGTALERLGNWSEAKTAYEIAIGYDSEENGRHFAAHYNLGTLLFTRLNDPATARVHLAQAKEIDPKRPEPYLNLAVIAEARHDLGQAEQLFNTAVVKAADHAPAMLATIRWRRALFYWHNDLPGKATKVLAKLDLEQLLEKEPDFQGANGLLGQYYESVAEYEKAVRYFSREVQDGNFDSSQEIDLDSHYYLTLIHTDHLLDPEKARFHAMRYYKLRPDAKGDALRRRAQAVFDAQHAAGMK